MQKNKLAFTQTHNVWHSFVAIGAEMKHTAPYIIFFGFHMQIMRIYLSFLGPKNLKKLIPIEPPLKELRKVVKTYRCVSSFTSTKMHCYTRCLQRGLRESNGWCVLGLAQSLLGRFVL